MSDVTVLAVLSEIYPLIKTGALADVPGAPRSRGAGCRQRRSSPAHGTRYCKELLDGLRPLLQLCRFTELLTIVERDIVQSAGPYTPVRMSAGKS